jgi:hypothetical protein
MSQWTHIFFPIAMFRLYGEHCRIVKRRGGLMGKLFGDVYIETNKGYRGWQDSEDVIESGEAA